MSYEMAVQALQPPLWQTVFFWLAAIGCGMAAGSYCTMPYYRLPNGIPCAGKWIGKKSACTQCGVTLRTRDLLPVLNWLVTRGKCHSCKTPVNPVYFFIESSMVLFSLIFHTLKPIQYNVDLYLLSLAAASCYVVLMATDVTYRKLPWQAMISLLAVTLIMRAMDQQALSPVVMDGVVVGSWVLVVCWCIQKITKRPLTSLRYPFLITLGGLYLSVTTVMYWLPLGVALSALLWLFWRLTGRSKRAEFSSPPYALAIGITILATQFYLLYLDTLTH